MTTEITTTTTEQQETFSLQAFDHAQRVAKALSASTMIPKDYALNKNNKQVIKDFIEGTPRTNNYGKESDEEIEELIEDTLKDNKPIIIKFKPFIHQYEKKRGAFFPYYNISSLDLTEYQITKGNATYYKDNHAHNILAENCLIYAMRMQNMEENMK